MLCLGAGGRLLTQACRAGARPAAVLDSDIKFLWLSAAYHDVLIVLDRYLSKRPAQPVIRL